MSDTPVKVDLLSRYQYHLRYYGWRVVLQDGEYRFECYDAYRAGSFVPEWKNLHHYLNCEAAVVLPPTPPPIRPRTHPSTPLVLKRKYVPSKTTVSFHWKLVTFHPEGHVVAEKYLEEELSRKVERKNRSLGRKFSAALWMHPEPELVSAQASIEVEYPGHTTALRKEILIGGLPVTLPPYWQNWQSYGCESFPATTKERFQVNYLLRSPERSRLCMRPLTKETDLTNTSLYIKYPQPFFDGKRKIVSLERYQNCLTYAAWYARNQRVSAECGGRTDTWEYMFHGTRNTHPDVILSSAEGFDVSKASDQGMLGSGIYFAKNPLYSEIFSSVAARYEKDGNRYEDRLVIISRVCTGNIYHNGHMPRKGLTAPPMDLDQNTYHSVHCLTVFKGVPSNNVAVYDGSLVYPEYLLRYSVLLGPVEEQ